MTLGAKRGGSFAARVLPGALKRGLGRGPDGPRRVFKDVPAQRCSQRHQPSREHHVAKNNVLRGPLYAGGAGRHGRSGGEGGGNKGKPGGDAVGGAGRCVTFTNGNGDRVKSDKANPDEYCHDVDHVIALGGAADGGFRLATKKKSMPRRLPRWGKGRPVWTPMATPWASQ